MLKFRGAGQGPRALIAELVGGEIARAAGLPVPELVFVRLDGDLARTEPDPEIQDLIRASGGLNLGLDYLSGALAFDPLVDPTDSELASRIVWLDAFVTNLDRTARNTNMLVWHRKLWLIDHGAALYFHHAGLDDPAAALNPFPLVRDHVLLAAAGRIAEVDAAMAARLSRPVLQGIVGLIPTVLGDAAATRGPRPRRRAVAPPTRSLPAPPRRAGGGVTEAVRAHDEHV